LRNPGYTHKQYQHMKAIYTHIYTNANILYQIKNTQVQNVHNNLTKQQQ